MEVSRQYHFGVLTKQAQAASIFTRSKTHPLCPVNHNFSLTLCSKLFRAGLLLHGVITRYYRGITLAGYGDMLSLFHIFHYSTHFRSMEEGRRWASVQYQVYLDVELAFFLIVGFIFPLPKQFS